MVPTARSTRGARHALRLVTAAALAVLTLGLAPAGAQDTHDDADLVDPVFPTVAPVAGRTERVTVSTTGAPLAPLDAEIERAVTSTHGRFVAFDSEATNLVPGGPNPNAERSVYVVDRLRNTTEMVSVSSNEAKGNGFSWDPSISRDGRFVAFYSEATNLVPGDTNGFGDIFVRDLVAGTTERVSVTSTAGQLTAHSMHPDISANGNVVAFVTAAPAVLTDNNGFNDVYVHDRSADTTGRVSISTANVQGNGESLHPSLDADGSIVAFESAATTLVAGDTNGFGDIFVRDRQSSTTERVSIKSNEAQAVNGTSEQPDVSSSGRYVAFHSAATDLVPGAGGSTYVVVVRDRQSGNTELQSHRPDGTPATRGFNPTISADGRRVAFMSRDSLVLAGAACEPFGVVRDRPSGVIIRSFPVVSGVNCAGRNNTISPDGRYLVAPDALPNVLPPHPGDNDSYDVYVRILADNVFNDVDPAHPFFEDVSWLVDTGVTTGFPGNVFKPGDPVTRGAMAAFLYRYTGANDPPPPTPTFNDVGTGNVFYKEIEWMVSEGFTNGFAGNVFRPGAPVTREAMAAFVYRLAGQPAFTPPATPTFNDVGTGHLFRKEIEWMAANGLANGFNDGGFHPSESIARQATAAFLFRFEQIAG